MNLWAWHFRTSAHTVKLPVWCTCKQWIQLGAPPQPPHQLNLGGGACVSQGLDQMAINMPSKLWLAVKSWAERVKRENHGFMVSDCESTGSTPTTFLQWLCSPKLPCSFAHSGGSSKALLPCQEMILSLFPHPFPSRGRHFLKSFKSQKPRWSSQFIKHNVRRKLFLIFSRNNR